MTIIKPPTQLDDISFSKYKIFLGGSIEMGKAEDWQSQLATEILNLENSNDIVILNPRRVDWDSSWEQDPTFGTKFYEQVEWEMDMQEYADLRLYYFSPETVSPITLLELGLYGPNMNTVACCPKNYFRYGNVQMVCDRYNIPLLNCLGNLVQYVKLDYLDWLVTNKKEIKWNL